MKSISPTVWGPAGWHILHRMSFEFISVKDAHSFIISLKYILPCQKCRSNLKSHIEKLPIPNDVKDIPLWMWQLHNRVTQSIERSTSESTTMKTPPSFKRVENIYKLHTEPVKKILADESIFLLAIVETHPGARSISKDYLDGIHTFIKHYVSFLNDESYKIRIDKEKIRSKVAFRELIKSMYKNQNKTDMSTLFNECT